MVPSQPLIALPLAVVLMLVTLPIARRVAAAEQDPGLVRLIMWAGALHMLFAPMQIWVVDHYYHGITDYNRYVDQGSVLARRFDAFHGLSGTNTKFLGAGAVSVFAGIVMAVVGVDKLACFFVFGWLAFLGSICFYRAFSVTFPEANCRRYARMIFFVPSILFWTAGVSKETIMYVALGIAAYGAARVIAQLRGGALITAAGTLLGVYIRPQEFVLFLSVFTFAALFRRRSKKRLGFLRRLIMVGVQVTFILGAAALSGQLAKHGGIGLGTNLNNIAQNNAGQTSSIHYSSNPALYWRDVYYVLLDPLPINAHHGGQRVAAVENSVLIGIFLTSLRRMRYLPKLFVMRTYTLASFLYVAIFCYVFAALGNLGLIDRERVLMLPLLFVLFCVPVTPKGQPPDFEWEMNRRQRKRRRGKQSPVAYLRV
jgi:hypothetical protein